MLKALQRILRIRQLAEEQARLEVERAAQRARLASAACTAHLTREHEQRRTLAASWIPPPPEEPAISRPTDNPGPVKEEKRWLMEEAVLEFFGWRRMRLEELRETELQRIEPLVATYTGRRRELRQTEQLVEQRAAIEAMEKNRRAQAETDEWFSQRTLMQQRRELHRPNGEAPLKPDESAHRHF